MIDLMDSCCPSKDSRSCAWHMNYPHGMRSKLLCPKCGHNHILLVTAVPDSKEVGVSPGYLNITVVAEKERFLSNKTLGRAGHVQAAVCKHCGFTELYTHDPSAIPIDGEYVREGVGPVQ